MALPVSQQVRIWSIAIALFLVVMWFLGNVIMPFILAGAVAYLLDPIADWLERHGFSRVMATVTISVFAVLMFAVVSLAILPTLIRQANALIETAPEIFQNLRNFLNTRFPEVMDGTSPISQSLLSIGETLQSKGGELAQTVLSSALSLINILVLIVVVPVVAFYLLLDWDNMVAKVDELLPRDHAPVIRRLARDIDKTLASFIRGQGTVMLILGMYYAIALMLVGLNFGLVAGALAGLLTFIPYVGALVGGALSLGLALFQFWGEWWMIAIVAAIFFSGQFLEGNILTPKLVGTSVGLHPVWLLLALSVFGTLFGFVGMLVAVPVAASIGVIARFFVSQYKEGLLYRGQEGADARAAAGEENAE